MNHKRLLLIAGLMINLHFGYAQAGENIKFGKITPADFTLTAEKFDSGSNALIIADIGTVKFEGNNEGSFNIIITRFKRVKVINKNGIDVGSFEISLFHAGSDAERIVSLKGTTFNLENGVVKETRLDDKSVFTQKFNANLDDKKFSMPALKEGSIFDLEYTVKSPYLHRLNPWAFQGAYPRLWSEYTVIIPPCLHYVMREQGDTHFHIDTTMEVASNYTVRVNNGATANDDIYNITDNSTYRRWVKTNVPALQEEPFTTTIDNYNSQITFQLEYIQWTKTSDRHYQKSTWNLLSKSLMEDEDFGRSLNSEAGWMTEEVNKIIQGAKTEDEKTYKIYTYIRNNIKSGGERGIYKQNSFKDIFRKKTGGIADINLLLTAMLISAGINAEPVILSTRDNGIADPGYPLTDEYNYVVCVAFPDKKLVTLDASKTFMKYGELPLSCYNGYGHIINLENPIPIFFISDSITEKKLTNVIIINDDKGKPSGGFTSMPGRGEAYDVREEISSSSVKAYEKKLSDRYAPELAIENFGIDSLQKYDFPISIHYDFTLKNLSSQDILYFNPMLNEAYKTNPFKSSNRLYPVEMPYRIDETYTLNMDIPTGYKVDEIPKSARVLYNENEGMFEYLIQKSDESIQLRVRLKLNKAFFPTDEYGTLRDFFASVVGKEGEQIVFKKIK
jgi:hypothetical protein